MRWRWQDPFSRRSAQTRFLPLAVRSRPWRYPAAYLDCSRSAEGIGQDIDQALGRKMERLAERQRFAQRLPVDQQRQVDGEFQDRTRAKPLSNMLDPTAELLEDWHRTGH